MTEQTKLILSFADPRVMNFILKTQGLKLPKISKISFNEIGSDERKLINGILHQTSQINVLEVGAKGNTQLGDVLDVGNRKMGNRKMGNRKVVKALAFVWFTLNQNNLKIFDGGINNLKQLLIRSWRVELNSKSILDPKLNYYIQELDLMYLARENNNLYIDLLKMKKIWLLSQKSIWKIDSLWNIRVADW